MKRKLFFAFALLAVVGAHAQSDDCGLWLNAGAEKRLSKKVSVGVDVDFRTRNDFRTVDRWSANTGVSYKVTKWLKADAGYSLLYDNRQEKLTYNLDDEGGVYSYNNWRPGYWSTRHRFNVSMTGEVGFGDFEISLRERWQYTYRPAKTTERYDFDNEGWEETTVDGTASHLLRSRLQVEYARKKATFKPFVNAELFNGMSLEKVRLTLGTDIRLNKHHVLEVFYRCQFTNDKEADSEPNCHYAGAGYTFKF